MCNRLCELLLLNLPLIDQDMFVHDHQKLNMSLIGPNAVWLTDLSLQGS